MAVTDFLFGKELVYKPAKGKGIHTNVHCVVRKVAHNALEGSGDTACVYKLRKLAGGSGDNVFGGDAAPHFKAALIVAACKQSCVQRAHGRTCGYLKVNSKLTDSRPKSHLIRTLCSAAGKNDCSFHKVSTSVHIIILLL